jgi:hypothetical protein
MVRSTLLAVGVQQDYLVVSSDGGEVTVVVTMESQTNEAVAPGGH